MFQINQENIPTELKTTSQWVCWKGEIKKEGKMGKMPINPHTGRYARVTDSTTWGSFEQAVACCENRGLNGVGFVFSNSDPFAGIDLDNCYDEKTRSLTPNAMEMVNLFNSYTEFSPSGKGLHIIVKGRLPGTGHRKSDIEIYDRDRFFTVTGNLVDGSKDIKDCREELMVFEPLSEDDNIIQMAMKAENGAKFTRLWKGDTSGYPTPSEADMALCQMLGYWTHQDREKIDRLFRKSDLYRPKWDRSVGDKTYGQATIDKVLGIATQPVSPKFNRTDLGNAERLIHRHGRDIRYCHAWKCWLIWDRTRWAVDKCDHVKQLAKEVVRSIYAEAEQASDSAERKEIARHAVNSESNRHIAAMISLAESEVPIKPDELDQDPWLFNCANGTIDLRTGRLREHCRDDFITKAANVLYNPNAPCPVWESFLSRILEEDPDLISFMQRAIGYSLTGLIDEQCLFILYGNGANGKTTFLQAVSFFMADYAMQTPTETLLVKGKGAIPNDVARLKGARFVTASEAEAEQRLAENLIKQMTGGDTISARFLHQEYFDFKPTHKLFLGTNHKPVIKGTDHAIWRRIRLIPFEVTIPEDERDPEMLEKLCSEAEGILAWAVEGCRLWQTERLGMPPAVKKATEGYRSEMDIIAQFIAERCETGTGCSITSRDLYQAFTDWCSHNGEETVSKKMLTQRLKELGYEPATKIGPLKQRGLKGLTLLPADLE